MTANISRRTLAKAGIGSFLASLPFGEAEAAPPEIIYVGDAFLQTAGRPLGVLVNDIITPRKVNLYFKADGSAGVNLFLPESGIHHGVKVALPAPAGQRLRAALFCDDPDEWDALSLES